MDIQHVANMKTVIYPGGILSQMGASNQLVYNTITTAQIISALRGTFSNKQKMFWTDKRKLAQKRNFNKYRLTGFNLDKSGLTQEEIDLYDDFKRLMMDKWDEGTGQLGLVPRKAIKEQKERIKNLNNQQ